MKLFSELFRDLCIGALAGCLCWSIVTLSGSTRDLLQQTTLTARHTDALVVGATPDLLATVHAVRRLAEDSEPTAGNVAAITADFHTIADRLAAPPDAKAKKLSLGDRVIRFIF